MSDQDSHGRLKPFLVALENGSLSDEQAAEMRAVLRDDPAARKYLAQYLVLEAMLEWDASAPLAGESTLTRSVSEVVTPSIPARSASKGVTQGGQSHFAGAKLGQSPTTFRVSAIAAAVAFIAIGILAYSFWSGSGQPPVVQQIPANVPAAKIVSGPDAKWDGANAPGGDTLTTGQRLVLQSGSAEITFKSQARVMLEGPAEFVVVDAGACRLAQGKLTAHVPDPAKGFKVHTPSGTVTDLGTEFGVYVDTQAQQQTSREEEQQPGGGPQFDGKQQPVTEVHVFKGKVDVAPGDQLAQAAGENPPPKSEIGNQKSKIVSAGEAVTISENKIQPLPAADPFKFALDKLQGKPRAVLLTEDFEKYDVGLKQGTMGDWMIQGSTRKGQAVATHEYDKWLAHDTATSGLPDPSLNPPPPSISRILRFAPSAGNPKNAFPRVAHVIEAPQLAHTCQVLVEFVIITIPNQAEIEPSFALAAEAGPAPGIEVWRNVDPAAPLIPWKTNLVVYRVRVLMNVVEGTLRDARVERSQWSGDQGWVRDAGFQTPVPKVDWTTPPKFAIFGYPVVNAQTPAGHYNIDNIRIEVIAEK